jgi:cation diffusion facilitator family transporter
LSQAPASRSTPARLVAASAAASVVLLVGLSVAFALYDSRLALAQAADSLADALSAVALMWAIRVSHRPPDEDHPFGHQGAQPIAALIVAVLAGVLAAEVLREAITALLHDARPDVSIALLSVLGAKVAIKGALMALTKRALRQRRAPALVAFYVDARNDVAIGTASVVGLAASKYLGLPILDAVLAIPVGLWVAWSGLALGLENADLLMGTRPVHDRLDELRRIAGAVPGVLAVADLQARHHGLDIHLWVEIHVDADLTVREAHDIGEAVERLLEAEEDVCRADAHVDATAPG